VISNTPIQKKKIIRFIRHPLPSIKRLWGKDSSLLKFVHKS